MPRLLTESQSTAVNSPGNLVVQAAAGSGKTTVLVRRFIEYLVTNPEVELTDIVAITFTRKAAQEMMARIIAEVDEYPDDLDGMILKNKVKNWVRRANISTIHGFCASLCRKFPIECGVDPQFSVIEGDLQDYWVSQVVDDVIGTYPHNQPLNLALAVWTPEQVRWILRKSVMNYQFRAAFECPQSGIDDPLRVAVQQLVEMANRRYMAKKQELNCIDNDDLIHITKAALEQTPSIRAYYQSWIRWVMVDEFQDTDRDQWQIVSAIVSETDPFESGKLFIVGDLQQSIYRFRGADPALFESIISGVKSGELLGTWAPIPDHFRAVPELVNAINHIFEPVFDDSPFTYLPLHPMRSDEPAQFAITVTDKKGAVAQAPLIATWIKECIQNGAEYGDIAILLRNKKSISGLVEALESRGIPTHTQSSQGFYKTDEVVMVYHLMKTLLEPEDSFARLGVFKSPLFPLSDDAIASRWCGVDTELSDVDTHLLAEYDRLIPVWRSRILDQTPHDAIRDILTETGMWTVLSGQANGDTMVRNLEKLLTKFRTWDAITDSTWSMTMQLFEHRILTDHAESEDVGDTRHGVQLMTIHAAKGLQFPYVVLPELERRFGTNRDPVTYTPEYGIQIMSPESHRSAEYETLKTALSQIDREEEKRILYVACTRAEQGLCLIGQHPKRGKLAKCLFDFVLKDAEVFQDHVVLHAGGTPLRVESISESECAPMSKETDETIRTLPEFTPLSLPKPLKPISVHEYLDRFNESLEPVTHPTKSDNAAEIGQIVHRGIESIIRQKQWSKGWIDTWIDTQAIDLPTNDLNTIKAQLTGFQTSELALEIQSAKTVLTEYAFTQKRGSDLISGRIDLIIQRGTHWVIIDYKTGRHPDLQRLAQRHAPQLEIYASALTHLLGEGVSVCASVYSTHHCQTISVYTSPSVKET